MYDTVLIPTDGSEQATNAVKTGLSLAAELGATVHALTVIEVFEGRIVPVTAEQEELNDRYHERGEEIVGGVARAAEAVGVDCVTAVAEGAAHAEIERYVGEHGVDLVVMGSRGLSNFDKTLVGSTVDRVVRTLDVPTTVVHEQPEAFADVDPDVRLDGW